MSKELVELGETVIYPLIKSPGLENIGGDQDCAAR